MTKLADYKVVGRAIPQKEIVDYGVTMLGAPLEWNETKGKGIKVGVIDTGIDINHEDLQGRVQDFINFTSDNPQDINDQNGHGTHVAGIIGANKNGKGVVGVAPECDLYIAKAFSDKGESSPQWIHKSLTWMIEKNVQVVNMSYTSQSYDETEHRLISKGIRRGITFVGAAGNNGISKDKNTIGYPAKYKDVIAVTAVNIDKQRAPFSSVGTEAQLAAAGTDILSTFKNNTYAVLSGTSMATPLISGAIALLQSKAQIRMGRFLSPQELSLVMKIYADDLGNFGKDSEYGYGLFSFGRF